MDKCYKILLPTDKFQILQNISAIWQIQVSTLKIHCNLNINFCVLNTIFIFYFSFITDWCHHYIWYSRGTIRQIMLQNNTTNWQISNSTKYFCHLTNSTLKIHCNLNINFCVLNAIIYFFLIYNRLMSPLYLVFQRNN